MTRTEAARKPQRRVRRRTVGVRESAPSLAALLPWRAYQRAWVNDPARLMLAVKAAQIGYSTATAAWAIGECLRRESHLVVVLSRSEAQAKELVHKAKLMVDKLGGVEAEVHGGFFQRTQKLEHYLRFPNRSRIIALSSDPDTARGYTGDVVLDEFAFHKDSGAVFQAAYRQITLGYSMRVLSTPNGRQGRFWELARACGIDAGLRPRPLPVPSAPWSGHWCDAELARECGFKIDLGEIRAGCDERTWLQEYCCQFLSTEEMWIAPDLYGACAAEDASTGAPPAKAGLFAGWDIGRSGSLSCVWFLKPESDAPNCSLTTCGLLTMRDIPTPDQLAEVRAWMPFVRRMAVDCTGMGLAVYEALDREFRGAVDGVTFTAKTKEAMAVHARDAMEKRLVRLPDSPACRRAFSSVRRAVNAVGSARFDAEHDSQFGHADEWWAFCLALMAAQSPGSGSLADVYHEAAPREVEAPVFSGFMRKVL